MDGDEKRVINLELSGDDKRLLEYIEDELNTQKYKEAYQNDFKNYDDSSVTTLFIIRKALEALEKELDVNR